MFFFLSLLESLFTWLKDTKSLVFLLLSCVKWIGAAGGFRNGKYGKLYIDYFSLKGLNALGVWIDIVIFLRLYLIFGMWLYTGWYMNMGWLEDFIFQAWCDGECFVGNYEILMCFILRVYWVYCFAWKLLVEFNEDFRWMWCYVWFSMNVWIWGLCVQTKDGLWS